MSKCTCSGCNSMKIFRSTRGNEIVNNQTLNNQSASHCGCNDICMHPEQCEPDLLTMIAPTVYDEVGINLCRFVPFPDGFLTEYPDVRKALVEVVNIEFGEDTAVFPLATTPYCVRIVLSGLTVTFSAKLLDSCGRYIDTVQFTVEYLDPTEDNDYYDEVSNPYRLALELYAPYGTSFSCDEEILAPVIQFLGLNTCNNTIPQGIVIQGLAKVLEFDQYTGGFNIGLTLYCKSVYAIQYKVPHAGIAVPPKAEPEPPRRSSCMDFIEGDLLERDIKPLDLSGLTSGGNGNNNGNGNGNDCGCDDNCGCD